MLGPLDLEVYRFLSGSFLAGSLAGAPRSKPATERFLGSKAALNRLLSGS